MAFAGKLHLIDKCETKHRQRLRTDLASRLVPSLVSPAGHSDADPCLTGGSSSLPTNPPECTGVPWPRAPQYFSSRISVSSLMRSQSKFHAGHTVGAIPRQLSYQQWYDTTSSSMMWCTTHRGLYKCNIIFSRGNLLSLLSNLDCRWRGIHLTLSDKSEKLNPRGRNKIGWHTRGNSSCKCVRALQQT